MPLRQCPYEADPRLEAPARTSATPIAPKRRMGRGLRHSSKPEELFVLSAGGESELAGLSVCTKSGLTGSARGLRTSGVSVTASIEQIGGAYYSVCEPRRSRRFSTRRTREESSTWMAV